MNWMKRRRFRQDSIAKYARRYDRTGEWCVCEIHSTIGLGYRVIAIRIIDGREFIASRHRTVSGAKRQIERLARQATSPRRKTR